MSTARKEMNEHDPARGHLVDWLRDAHAMEKQAEKMLEGQAKRLENYPEVKARVEQHIIETQRQAREVEQCLKSLGEDTSALKDAGGKAMALMQAMGGMVMSDEVLKGAVVSYAFEHMEIASYTVLVSAAHAAGEIEVAHACERILQEEKAMAAWLAEHTPATVQQFLQRERTGQPSKR